MKKLIPCNSSQFRANFTFYFDNGEVQTLTMYIPKTQKEEAIRRIFALNPRIVRVVATEKHGKVVFDKRRGDR